MIPECLTRSSDLLAALNEAEAMKESILSHPKGCSLSAEIDFLEDQIVDLKRQQSENKKETQKVYLLLRKSNNFAYVAASLRYSCGYSWEEVGDILNIDPDIARMRLYHAFKRLYKTGLLK